MAEKGKKFSESIRDFYNKPEIAKNLPISTSDDLRGGMEVVTGTPTQEAARGPQGRAQEQAAVVSVPLTDYPQQSSRGKRMVPVAIPKGVSPELFRRVLSGAYQSYLSTGRLVAADIAELSGVPRPQVDYLFTQQEFGYALAIRGIDAEGTSLLTPEQDAALMILTDTTSRLNWNRRLEKAGVSPAKLAAWRKNPAFQRALTGTAEQITANYDVALIELGRKVGEGDQRAIEKSLEISGRFNPAQQSTVDALVIINKVMESLSKHLAGQPEILQAVAKDMREISQEASQTNRTTIGL